MPIQILLRVRLKFYWAPDSEKKFKKKIQEGLKNERLNVGTFTPHRLSAVFHIHIYFFDRKNLMIALAVLRVNKYEVPLSLL